MFKIHDTKIPVDAENREPNASLQKANRHVLGYLLDVCIIVVMGMLLFWGASTQFYNQYNDVHRYQCYAVAFWHGTPALSSLPKGQCDFLQGSSSTAFAQKLQSKKYPAFLVKLVQSQSTLQPLHALPPEYPILTIAPFSLVLPVPQDWYQGAFAIFMALMAGVIYFVLKHYRSTRAAIAFAVYLVLGSWAIAEGRFDLIPAALTLGAVILAARARWQWAYALLALATMLKFYPVVLLAPFLIAQQMQFQGRWNSWRRLSGLGVFVGICAVLTVLSLVLNVADTISPLRYFVSRPIQVESLPATLLWLASLVGHPIQYVFTFQSLNFESSLSSKVSLLFDVCLVIGLLYTFWLQWRGKLDIYTASLMTLLVVMITGKVFSPQYLVWIIPLIAYVGQANWKWLVSWSIVGILTTVIYPYLYVTYLIYKQQYYTIVLVRDVLLLVITLALLFYAGRFGLLTEAMPKQVALEAEASQQDSN